VATVLAMLVVVVLVHGVVGQGHLLPPRERALRTY
jgi:hypothetical protein